MLDCLAQIESQTRWFLNPGLLLQIRLMQFVNPDTNKNEAAKTEQQNTTTQNQNIQSSTSTQITETKPTSSNKPTPPIQNTAKPTPQYHANSSKPTGFKQTISIPKPDQDIPNNSNNTQPTPAVSSTQVSGNGDIAEVKHKWPEFLEIIKKEHLGLYTILRSSQVVAVDNNEVIITLEQNIQFFMEKLTEETYQKAIQTYLQQQFNKPLTLKVSDMQQEAVEIEMVSAVSEMVKTTTDESGSDAIQEVKMPEPNTEQSINDIVTLFEGKIL